MNAHAPIRAPDPGGRQADHPERPYLDLLADILVALVDPRVKLHG